jgi:16S rRNA (adenine1518-N6/adenine1519-N6)-dimethyltransferase
VNELVPNEGGRPQWSVFKAELEARGFHPSRRFGQNFLLDENMVRAIVRDSGVGPGDFVLEVGSGCGFLSLHLLRAGVDLVSVEVDSRLVEITRALLANEARFTLVEGDVLASKHALAPAVIGALPTSAPWHLVSNLPYAVSGPVMACAAELANAPASMTVLVQKEVALRIVAQPASDDWGPLSVRLQIDYEARLVRDVPSGLFWPRPKVESSVVRLKQRAVRWPAEERRALSRLVDELFQRRRKTLGRVLSDLTGERQQARDWLARAGADEKARAEDLSLEALARLAREDPRGTARPA